VSRRLLDLLERGDFDWDNPRHREAYLRAWVNGDLKDRERALDDERRPAGDRSLTRTAPEHRQDA
jgi:hypothetical protein